MSAHLRCASPIRAYATVLPLSIRIQSASNIAQLDKLGIKFTMALKRSTKGLDYSIFASRTNDGADGAFLYHKKPIWWKRFEIDGHEVFLYLDEAHRSDESEDYMRRVFDPEMEEYTMDGYKAKSLQFGTLALMSTSGKMPNMFTSTIRLVAM